jgi:hypothetical protein
VLVLALEADLDLIAIPPDDVGPPVPGGAGMDERDPVALPANLDRPGVAETVRAALRVPELLAGLDRETSAVHLRVEPPFFVLAEEFDLDLVRDPLFSLGFPTLVWPGIEQLQRPILEADLDLAAVPTFQARSYERPSSSWPLPFAPTASPLGVPSPSAGGAACLSGAGVSPPSCAFPPSSLFAPPVAPQAEIVTAAAVSSASRTLPAAEPSKRRNANLPPS